MGSFMMDASASDIEPVEDFDLSMKRATEQLSNGLVHATSE